MKVLFISFIYFIKIRPIKHIHVKKKTENTMAKRKKDRKYNGQKKKRQKIQWPKEKRERKWQTVMYKTLPRKL